MTTVSHRIMIQLQQLEATYPDLRWSAVPVAGVAGATDFTVAARGLDILISATDSHEDLRCHVNGRFDFEAIDLEVLGDFLSALASGHFAVSTPGRRSWVRGQLRVEGRSRIWTASY
jgi:hypothetical protein